MICRHQLLRTDFDHWLESCFSSDSGSGVNLVEIRTDDTDFNSTNPLGPEFYSSWNGTVHFSQSGTYNIFARAIDGAGNEMTSSVTVHIILSSDVTYPIKHMDDRTASGGRALNSANSIRAEYVSPTSQLIGDSIDQITLRLGRIGSPTGMATIGIFDSVGNVKKQFGSIDTATIGTAYTDYTFSLTQGDLYTIQAGDRIGIKYPTGTATNYISVMTDTDAADPFDGINSYRQWLTTSWQSLTSEDMYMILRQTHAAEPIITHMSDTTASGGRTLYSANSIRAEYVSPTPQLVGDSIDQITLRLQKIGFPTGDAVVGIFDSAGNMKKQFGSKEASSFAASYTDYTFTLANNELYTLQAGDRVGIRFAGGNATNYVNTVVDTDAVDPFDGTNSYRQWFTTSWQSYTGEDMYLILKQTH